MALIVQPVVHPMSTMLGRERLSEEIEKFVLLEILQRKSHVRISE